MEQNFRRCVGCVEGEANCRKSEPGSQERRKVSYQLMESFQKSQKIHRHSMMVAFDIIIVGFVANKFFDHDVASAVSRIRANR